MSTVEQTSSQNATLALDGHALNLQQLYRIAIGDQQLTLTDDPAFATRMAKACELVSRAVNEGWSVYGVTTGFGGMADVPVPHDMSAASQNNLMSFLATGAGEPIDRRHVRAAMALRANVLLQGHSGVRMEIVNRLITFLNHDAVPIVRCLGSIGASGDLVPLSSIARAITGQSPWSTVSFDGTDVTGREALKRLELEPIELLPKEGLALVNGTSFSTAIAANCVSESRNLMALSMATNAMLMAALNVHRQPFEAFVHQLKPHPGQRWSAAMTLKLLGQPSQDPPHLNGASNGKAAESNGHTGQHAGQAVQDRYSVRCYPQYMGSAAETIARVGATIETEMNSVSDNPLIDSEAGKFYQSGNFLGQYIGVAMDDLRKQIGLMAKHLDVQIASVVAPEFSNGLPPSLQGNARRPYNMGLKGLQITGNSIMPMLTWYGNPIVDHFPTHAEQFNQNINGLSWGSANLAWKSVELFRHYMATALIFAVQAIDLRAQKAFGHCDGRALLSPVTTKLYESVYATVDQQCGDDRPLIFDDTDQWLEQWLEKLTHGIASEDGIASSVDEVLKSFDEAFN